MDYTKQIIIYNFFETENKLNVINLKNVYFIMYLQQELCQKELWRIYKKLIYKYEKLKNVYNNKYRLAWV